MQPSHAGLLIRTQRRFQGDARIQLCQLGGIAKARQRLRQPRSGDDRRPARRGARNDVARHVRAGDKAHRFAKGETVLRRRRLHCPELVEHPAQSFAIEFDPASAHQVQAIRRGKQLLNLCAGQQLAVETDSHPEVEQRVRAETRRRLAPDGGRDLRT